MENYNFNSVRYYSRFLTHGYDGELLKYVLPNESGCVESEQLRLCLYVGEKALLQILESGRIKISCPWKTNDVTECVFQDETQQSLNAKCYGYVCMSSDFSSPKMWGLYAERSAGACLIFDFEVIRLDDYTYEVLDEDATSLLQNRLIIRKVIYDKYRSKCGDIDLMFRKSLTWKEEKEYRILFDLRDDKRVETELQNDGKYNINYYNRELFKRLTAVILGARCVYEENEICFYLRSFAKTNNLKEKIFFAGHTVWVSRYEPRLYVTVSRAEYSKDAFDFKVVINKTINMPTMKSYDSFVVKGSIKIISLPNTEYDFYSVCKLLKVSMVETRVYGIECASPFRGITTFYFPEVKIDKVDSERMIFLFSVDGCGTMRLHYDVSQSILRRELQKIKESINNVAN